MGNIGNTVRAGATGQRGDINISHIGDTGDMGHIGHMCDMGNSGHICGMGNIGHNVNTVRRRFWPAALPILARSRVRGAPQIIIGHILSQALLDCGVAKPGGSAD